MLFQTKNKHNTDDLCAPVSGEVVLLKNVADPTFSGGILGDGVAVAPCEDDIVSPADGEITMVADTFHAICLTSGEREILIHVGIDTVKLGGVGFQSHVKDGQIVKAGQKILTADREAIRAHGYDPVVVMIVSDPENYEPMELKATGQINAGEPLLRVVRK